jgi:hypothetical protein
MKLGPFQLRGVAITAPLLCLSLALLGLCSSMAQTQQSQSQSESQPQTQTQSQPGSASSPATPADDAAAKAAERKRRYDEQRKMMESGYSPSKEEQSRVKVDPDLSLSPMDVNLLVHDRVIFHVYFKGKEVTGNSWSAMPGRVLGSWFEKGGIFVIEAKSPGTARVGVEYNQHYANVIVTVYPGDKMPKGVDRTAETIKPAGSQ